MLQDAVVDTSGQQPTTSASFQGADTAAPGEAGASQPPACTAGTAGTACTAGTAGKACTAGRNAAAAPNPPEHIGSMEHTPTRAHDSEAEGPSRVEAADTTAVNPTAASVENQSGNSQYLHAVQMVLPNGTGQRGELNAPNKIGDYHTASEVQEAGQYASDEDQQQLQAQLRY